MNTITLGGQQWPIKEPVFRDLRKIVDLYRQLSDPLLSGSQASKTITTIMRLLVPDHRQLFSFWYRVRHGVKPLSQQEIVDFLQAIPVICKLQTVTAAEATSNDPWGEIYAFFACCNGYTWDEIDSTMTLSRSEQIQDYWLHNPPEHILQKAKIGYKYNKLDTVSDFFRKNRPRTLH